MKLHAQAGKHRLATLVLDMFGSGQVAPAEAAPAAAEGFDRSPWKQETFAAGPQPAARFAAAMGYDEDTGETVLFGGADAGCDVMNDTWTWDGERWTDRTPADPGDSPAPRQYGGMVYAGPGKGMLLFGGENLDYADKTWLWDGTKWKDATPADAGASKETEAGTYTGAGPETRIDAGTDAGAGSNTLIDAGTGAGSEARAIANWMRSPSPRIQFAMAYIGNGEVLLYGGFGPGGALRDTWIWNGTGWRDATPADPNDSPTSSHRTCMAYDRKNKQAVLFGGYTDAPPYLTNATWTWDGRKWTLRTPAASPSPRVFASMAYDAIGGKTILVGGEANYAPKQDAWLWDGSNWTEQTASNPPDLSLAAMAYDTRRGQSVLFGGYDGSVLSANTWTQRIACAANVNAPRPATAGHDAATRPKMAPGFGWITSRTRG
ncbi:kelch repeat-containing protein [Paenibacillus glycinis]|uniref:Galactose oxidase n=1 Tax=Paenibacillus glycinis TaxID=2697035 RepID=A0ABW9XNT3_9BACL|nr:kelch repeat-containing protein [Paenibacillus glycinis]NBD24279.1 hypothetical protein [Paenibacillus glycinis]